MRRLLSILTTVSVFIGSIPVLAQDVATLQAKDLDGRDLSFQIRNHTVLQFQRKGEAGWTNMDMSKFEKLGRKVAELFKVNDRLFYIFTEPASSSPSAQHVGEIVYQPISYLPNGRFIGWSGFGIMSIGGVMLGLADPGSGLASAGAGVFMAGVCIIGGGVFLPAYNGGTPATAESNQPICVSPDGNVKYEQAVLKQVHRNEIGQIIDVELAVEVSAPRPRIMSLLEITKVVSPSSTCDGEVKMAPRYGGIDP